MDGRPGGGRAEAWIYGIGIAGLLFGYGAYCVATQRAWFFHPRMGIGPNRGFLLQWSGQSAIALGTLFITCGLFAHFHWFWANYSPLDRYYEIFKLAALVGVVISLGWTLFLAAGWP